MLRVRSFSRSTRSMSTSTSSMPRLPRLPVPPLRKTLDRYLRSIEPFLLEDEANGGPSFEESYKLRAGWADEFERGIGAKAQEKLIALDSSPTLSPHNWLDDSIWLKKAYHEWRSPLPVNSNWWLTFVDDPNKAEESAKVAAVNDWEGVNAWQVRRAAWIVSRVLEFKEKLNSQELYPETTRTGLWLRDSTAKIFNTCRIPLKSCDALSPQPPLSAAPSASDNIVVMVHDWMYAVSCYDVHEGRKVRVEVGELERRLRGVLGDVKGRHGKAPAVGVLSADGRDKWAENYEYLKNMSSTNSHTLSTISQSLLALSLDHYTHTLPPDSPPNPHEPQSLTSHLHQIRSPPNAHNRFYDKPLTLIVDSSGRAGAMGEHSPCDALVPSIVCEYGVVQGVISNSFSSSSSFNEDVRGWERLDWKVDSYIEGEIQRVERETEELVGNSDDEGLWFGEYGADWIKNVALLSPDAYIQMALQLAWYKTRGEFTATYETALTRMFAKGRTETIRTFTSDSRAWVLSMVDPRSSLTTRKTLLHRAIQTHSSLTREAATGRGIDRHLLGLRLMISESGPGESSKLLEDELFARSQEWKLSTSGLSAGRQFHGTGFGAAYEDGYGINYLAGPDIIKFGIESKHSSPLTSTRSFKTAVTNSMKEMRTICLVNLESEGHVVSHL